MYVIAERINGMFKDVKAAIRRQDAAVIQDLAKRQMAAGASAQDDSCLVISFINCLDE